MLSPRDSRRNSFEEPRAVESKSQNLKQRLQEKIKEISFESSRIEVQKSNELSLSKLAQDFAGPSVRISKNKPIIDFESFGSPKKGMNAAVKSNSPANKSLTPANIRQLLKEAREQVFGNVPKDDLIPPSITKLSSPEAIRVNSKRSSSPIPYRRAVSQQKEIDMTKSPIMQRKFISQEIVSNPLPLKRSHSVSSPKKAVIYQPPKDLSWIAGLASDYFRAADRGNLSVSAMPASFYRHLTVAFLTLNRFYKYCQTYSGAMEGFVKDLTKKKKKKRVDEIDAVTGSCLKASFINIGFDLETAEVISLCHLCNPNSNEVKFKLLQESNDGSNIMDKFQADVNILKYLLDSLPVSVTVEQLHVQSSSGRRRSKSIDSSSFSTLSRGTVYPMDAVRAKNRRRLKNETINELFLALDSSIDTNERIQLSTIELNRANESGWCSLFGNENSLSLKANTHVDDVDVDDGLSIVSDVSRGRSRARKRGAEIISSPTKRRGDFGEPSSHVRLIFNSVLAGLKEHKLTLEDVFHVVSAEFPTGWIECTDIKRVFQVLGIPHISMAEVNYLRKYFFLRSINTSSNNNDDIPRFLKSDLGLSAIEIDTVVPTAKTIASALETVMKSEYVSIEDIRKAILYVQQHPVIETRENRPNRLTRSKSIDALSSSFGDFISSAAVPHRRPTRVASARRPPSASQSFIEQQTSDQISDLQPEVVDNGPIDFDSGQYIDDGTTFSTNNPPREDAVASNKLRRFLNERRFKGIKTDEMTSRIHKALDKRRNLRSQSPSRPSSYEQKEFEAPVTGLDEDFENLFDASRIPGDDFDMVTVDADTNMIIADAMQQMMPNDRFLFDQKPPPPAMDDDELNIVDDLTQIENDALLSLNQNDDISSRYNDYYMETSGAFGMSASQPAIEPEPVLDTMMKTTTTTAIDHAMKIESPLQLNSPVIFDVDQISDPIEVQSSPVESAVKLKRTPPSPPKEIIEPVIEPRVVSKISSIEALNIFFSVNEETVVNAMESVRNEDQDANQPSSVVDIDKLYSDAETVLRDKQPLDAFSVSMARILLASADAFKSSPKDKKKAMDDKIVLMKDEGDDGVDKVRRKPIAKSANSEKDREDILALVYSKN